MFFNEMDNYVDGGVICNNPTDYGLTAIQNYCRRIEYNIPIAAVVSVGTGTFPAEKIGSVDAQDALFFGKKWLKPGKLIKQTQNLMSLLSNAVSAWLGVHGDRPYILASHTLSTQLVTLVQLSQFAKSNQIYLVT